tara:strand:+ start:1051 stop:2184 length:1134 start_codon:yes stop_codon:yes gene_type:complete
MSELKVNSIKGTGASTAAITIDSSSGGCTANITNNLSNRRININGAALVNQRGDVTGITSTGYYGPDRLRTTIYGGTFSFSRAASGSTLPEFPRCFKIDCTSAASAPTGTQECKIGYDMEGQDVQHLNYGSSSAKKTTLTFYIRSNKTETYTVWYYRPDGNRMNAVNFTVSSANTWEKKTITIDGDTSNAIADDNTSGLKFEFVLASGTGFKSGSALNGTWADLVNVNRYVGNTGTFGQSTDDVVEITGIQFEVGEHATDFEHRTFGQELALCCRYFYGATDTIAGIFIADNADTDSAYGGIQFPVIMRAAPTVIFGDNAGNNAGVVTQHGAAHGIAATAGDIGKHGIGKCAKNSGNWDTGSAKPIAAKIVSADAEL